MAVVIPPDVIQDAQDSEAVTGVPASVTIAQWALESAWGSAMPLWSNNPFGMKALPGQPSVTVITHEFQGGQWLEVSADFRTFPDLKSAFDAHGLYLKVEPRYASCFTKGLTALDFCYELQKDGYATDPDYALKLTSIIKAHDLTKYDVA